LYSDVPGGFENFYCATRCFAQLRPIASSRRPVQAQKDNQGRAKIKKGPPPSRPFIPGCFVVFSLPKLFKSFQIFPTLSGRILCFFPLKSLAI
jgi:hypothetical protein